MAQNSAEPGESRKKVAEQIGISHDTISKEKKIIEHKDQIDPEDFKDWDDGKLSTNKVYVELKEKLRRAEQALDGQRYLHQNEVDAERQGRPYAQFCGGWASGRISQEVSRHST